MAGLTGDDLDGERKNWETRRCGSGHRREFCRKLVREEKEVRRLGWYRRRGRSAYNILASRVLASGLILLRRLGQSKL